MSVGPDSQRTITEKKRTTETRRGYSTWEQVAGYFDGDGSPKMHIGIYAITQTASWSDQDRELLVHIGDFLSKNGISCQIGRFSRGDSTYYELTVSESGNILLAYKLMLPHLDKKWSQVKAAIDYLENRITGNQFIEILNDAVRNKQRSSSLRPLNLPFTKREALQLANSSHRFHRSRALTDEELAMAKRDREVLGLSYAKLGEKYHVPESTMYYSLKRYT